MAEYAPFQQPANNRLPFSKSNQAFLQDIIASARIKSQGQGNSTARGQTPQKGHSQNRDLQQLMSTGKRKRENLVLTSYDGTRRKKTYANGGQSSFLQDTTLKTPQSSILEDNNSTGCTNLGGKSRGQFFLDRYQQNKSSQRGSLDTVRMGGNQSLVALPTPRSELTQDLRSSNRSTQQNLGDQQIQQKQMLFQTQNLNKQPADLAISSANFTIRRGSNSRGGGDIDSANMRVKQQKFQQPFMPQIISDSFSSEGLPQTIEQINPPIKIVTEGGGGGGNAINDSKFISSLAPSLNISTTDEEQYSLAKGGLNLDFLPQPAGVSQSVIQQILSPKYGGMGVTGGNRIVAVDQSLHVKGGSHKMRESMEQRGHQASLNANSLLKVMTAQRERSNGTNVNESANTQASVEVSSFLIRTQQNMANDSKLNENSNTMMFDSQISNEQSMNQNHNPGNQRLSSIFKESNIGGPNNKIKQSKQISLHELKNSINQWMPSGKKDVEVGQQYTNGILHNQLEPIITPELASKVVKNYLLPMFTTKRRINQSSSTMPQSPSHLIHPRLSKKIKILNTTTRKLSPNENTSIQSLSSPHHQQQNQSFVVSELQLNQELYNKLKQAEQLFLDAEEKLEASLQANRLLTRQIEQLRRNHEKMKIDNRALTQKTTKQEIDCRKYSIVIQQQEQQLAFYAKLYGQSEHNRKEVSSRCNELQSALDHDKNQVNSSKARCNLLEIEHDYVKNQLQLIYDSFASMTSTKLVSDHYEFEMIKLNKRIAESDQLKRDLEKSLLESNLKNDQLMRHIKDVKELFQSSIKKRDVQVNEAQEALKNCEEQRSALDAELTETKNRLHEAESNFKMAALEIVGLRKRIDKMKQISMKMFTQKICRNCLKEYNESENYNWSCRTHQGEYGGVIWWCCGRKNKDDPGCKYSKHESRDDNNENAGKSKLHDANNVDLSSIFQDFKTYNKDEHVRCYCCKQLGHSGTYCNKDPNFKTLTSNNLVDSVNQDEQRIQKNIEDEEKRKGINRLDLFNRYVQHQLETAQKLNKHAAAVQALMNYSVSPKRGGPLMNQTKSVSRKSFSTSDKGLTGTNRELNDSQSNAGGQATPNLANQADAIPSARTKSIAIVNDLKNFLLTFDDFNYTMINQQVVNKVETFKLDLQNPTETHTMEFDMANLQLLELHQAQQSTPIQLQGSSPNVNVTPKNSSTNMKSGANSSPMNRPQALTEESGGKSTFFKKNGNSGSAVHDSGLKKQRTIRTGLQSSSLIITGSDTSSAKEEASSEKQPPLKHAKTMKKEPKHAIKSSSAKKPLFDIDEEQFDDNDQQHIEAPKVQLVEIDIEEIKQMQQKEPFEELYDMKVLLSAQQKFLENSNLINILSYFQANKPKDTREPRFQGGSSQQKRSQVGKRNTNMFSDSSSNNQRLGGAEATSVDNNSSYQQDYYGRWTYQKHSSRNLDLASLVMRDYGGMPDPIPEETHSQAEISPQNWKNQHNPFGPAQNLANGVQISKFEPAMEPDHLHAVQLKQFLGLSEKDGRNIEELSREPSNSSPKFGEGEKPTNQSGQGLESILKPKPMYMKPHAQHSRKSIRMSGAILSETLAEINKKATLPESIEDKRAKNEADPSAASGHPPQQTEQQQPQLLKKCGVTE